MKIKQVKLFSSGMLPALEDMINKYIRNNSPVSAYDTRSTIINIESIQVMPPVVYQEDDSDEHRCIYTAVIEYTKNL